MDDDLKMPHAAFMCPVKDEPVYLEETKQRSILQYGREYRGKPLMLLRLWCTCCERWHHLGPDELVAEAMLLGAQFVTYEQALPYRDWVRKYAHMLDLTTDEFESLLPDEDREALEKASSELDLDLALLGLTWPGDDGMAA